MNIRAWICYLAITSCLAFITSQGGNICAQQPIPQPINTSNYNTIPKNGDFGDKRGTGTHEGIDVSAPAGTEVKATIEGKVIAAGTYGDGSYGNVVIIKSNDGNTITLDAHLKNGSISVKVGDEVKARDKIGEVNNTGSSTSGDHLHH